MRKLIELLRRLRVPMLIGVPPGLGHTSEPAPPSPAERLAATLKPNPEYRRRRLEHFPPDRVQKYLKNVADLTAKPGEMLP